REGHRRPRVTQAGVPRRDGSGAMPVSGVLSHPLEAHHDSRRAQRRLTERVDPALLAVGTHHAVVLLEGLAGTDRGLEPLAHPGPILGVDAGEVRFERAREAGWVD